MIAGIMRLPQSKKMRVNPPTVTVAIIYLEMRYFPSGMNGMTKCCMPQNNTTMTPARPVLSGLPCAARGILNTPPLLWNPKWQARLLRYKFLPRVEDEWLLPAEQVASRKRDSIRGKKVLKRVRRPEYIQARTWVVFAGSHVSCQGVSQEEKDAIPKLHIPKVI